MPSLAEKNRIRTWILRTLAATLWVVVVLVGIDYVLHRRFVEPLRRKQPPQWLTAVSGQLPPEVMRKVGFFRNTKRSSFLRFPKDKPAGVRRVCAFGDSFTHGDEVDDANDYPTLLQGLLDSRGAGRYEVLNFGSGSYGFHQAFILWEAFATTYGCDEILLGPATFFADRDTSFNHVGLGNPYYLHARYVLDGDGVRLIEVVGSTLEERFDEYLRFVPHLDYARFDRAPPAFLRAALRDGQTIANPFYYRSEDAGAEAFETYRRLLHTLVDAGKPVLVATAGDLGKMMRDIGSDTLRTFAPITPNTFPYGAPRNHRSPIGNELLAQEYLARLDPGAPQTATILATDPVAAADVPRDAAPAPPLWKYARVFVEIERVPVGHFVTGTAASTRKGSPELLQAEQIVSLVHVGGPRASDVSGGSMADGCFVPIDQPLGGSPEVCLRADRGGASSTRCIGRVGRLAAGVNVGTLELAGASIEDRPVLAEDNRLILTVQSPELAEFLRGATLIAVEVDGAPVLTGGKPVGDGILLSPGKRGCFWLRANEGGRVDVERLGPSGKLNLVLEPPRGSVARVPLASWRKVVVPLES